MVFMLTALINFEIYQNIFYQLRFFVNVGRDLSGYHDPLIAQIIMNIIKYPFIAISLIATGLIVAKTQPAAKSLAIFNVAIYIIAALLYVSFVFSRCNDRINREFDGKLTIPLCSSHCICKDIQFQPVCTTQGNVTYFSPCHAGCKTVETIRGIEVIVINLVGILELIFFVHRYLEIAPAVLTLSNALKLQQLPVLVRKTTAIYIGLSLKSPA